MRQVTQEGPRAQHGIWSIFQKYERGNETFCAILGERLIHEEIVQETKNWLSLGADSHRSMTE